MLLLAQLLMSPFYPALQILDGFLSLPVSLLTWIITLSLLFVAPRQVKTEFEEQAVPLMGVSAFFIFATQMINFPMPGGTLRHLIGGTLSEILLSSWGGTLVVAVVFIVQAVLFKYGGIIFSGANILNVGLLGAYGSYYLYKAICLILDHQCWLAVATATAVAAWISIMNAAIMTVIELSLSGTVLLTLGLGAVIFLHIFIGIDESIITMLTIGFI
jgi:cobalt/nickel transport system permease protein